MQRFQSRCRLLLSELLTYGGGSSSLATLPTPTETANMACPSMQKWPAHRNLLLPMPSAASYGTNQGGAAGRTGPVRESLETMARRESWPTPGARLGDEKRGLPTAEHAEKRFAEGRRNLDDAVAMWPTPNVPNGGRRIPPNATLSGRTVTHRGRKVQVGLEATVGGSLNPNFVEWLMGFPKDWTLGPQASGPVSSESPAECPTESPAFEPSATP